MTGGPRLGDRAEMYLDRVRHLAEGAGQRIVESLDEGLAERARMGLQRPAGGADAGRPDKQDCADERHDERHRPPRGDGALVRCSRSGHGWSVTPSMTTTATS